MSQTGDKETFQPLAGALAFVFPGLGHAYLGETRRAVCIGAGVLGLFFGGVLIGGIDVVDRVEDRWWFVGQAPVGPIAFATDWVHQNKLKSTDPRPGQGPDWLGGDTPKRTKSIGHPNEIGSLYATIAGMLNAICIIDALWHAPATRRRGGGRRGAL